MSSIGTDGLIDLDQLRTEIESQGGSVIGTTFPVTVSKGNVTYQVDQFGNITEPSIVPQISYKVKNTDGSEITGTTNNDLPESAKLNITITNISELTVTSITIKNSSGTEITGATIDLTQGTASVEITENGKYVVEIVATDKKGKNASGSLDAIVSGKIKIANLEANWTSADSSNTGNDWYSYAYKNDANQYVSATVNAPKLADGMTAIKYEIATGDLVTGSKWANAMTKDGSMWVWIPRYAYKITEGYQQGGADYKDDNGNPRGGNIEIKFLEGTSTITAEEETAGWKLHPAFTFGTGTDKEITGFWFAKFEASPVGAESKSAAQSIADIASTALQIKPDKFSWRNISSANIFSYCLNLKNMQSNDELVYFNNVRNVDTHMTKNVEWGAVAYLAHSKYGLNGEEICINTNSSYKTGYGIGNTTSTSGTGSTYNTTTGIKSSTTKNVYGIYDMSGGAYEYVAACLNTYTGYTDKLTNLELTTENDQAKYIDIYSAYNNSKYGDAVFETSSSSSGSSSWFSDCSSFVSAGYPVFKRGGYYNFGSNAGLFSFSLSSGNAGNDNGFRPVCVVK